MILGGAVFVMERWERHVREDDGNTFLVHKVQCCRKEIDEEENNTLQMEFIAGKEKSEKLKPDNKQ